MSWWRRKGENTERLLVLWRISHFIYSLCKKRLQQKSCLGGMIQGFVVPPKNLRSWSWTKQWLRCIHFLGWHHPHSGVAVCFCFFEYILCCCLCFRSRLADFQQNCQPSPKSASGCVRESRAMCLKAYSGLIGETDNKLLVNWDIYFLLP